MKFSIITIFPEAFESYISSSILKRAAKRRLIKIDFFNPRNFTKGRHKVVDAKPFGGGPGMVIKAEPILKAVRSALKLKNKKTKIILLSARGKQFDSKTAHNWAKKYRHIILISGHYEGIDERVKKILKADEFSIGPFVLTGGELPAMAVVDAVSRYIPGVLGKIKSLEEKHGSYPVYTRPEVIEWPTYSNKKIKKKYKAPSVLLSGNHKEIEKWRKNNKVL